MSKESKKNSDRDYLQFRIPRDEEKGKRLSEKLQKIAAANGLSLNDVANLCVAAGLNMVESKLREIHEPEKQAA